MVSGSHEDVRADGQTTASKSVKRKNGMPFAALFQPGTFFLRYPFPP
jgi:hypothetical protein